MSDQPSVHALRSEQEVSLPPVIAEHLPEAHAIMEGATRILKENRDMKAGRQQAIRDVITFLEKAIQEARRESVDIVQTSAEVLASREGNVDAASLLRAVIYKSNKANILQLAVDSIKAEFVAG